MCVPHPLSPNTPNTGRRNPNAKLVKPWKAKVRRDPWSYLFVAASIAFAGAVDVALRIF